MGNDKYRESMEKNRQELSQERMAELSRRSRQAPKANSKGLLLPSLFFIFILIPVTLLIYVAFYYEPDDTLTAKTTENEVSFELNSQTPASGTVLAASEDSSEEERELKAQQAAEQKELKAKAREREAKAAEEEKQQAEAEAKAEADKKAQVSAAAEQKAREEAKAKALAQQQAEEKKQAEAEQKTQAEAEKETEAEQETPTAGGKTIVVQSSETLYRIAVNNYGASGAAAAVEKIKQANGLGSNNISPGQTLILP